MSTFLFDFAKKPRLLRFPQLLMSIHERPGFVLTRMEATDEDLGQNGIVRYALRRDNSSKLFKIKSNTGDLMLQNTINDNHLVSL